MSIKNHKPNCVLEVEDSEISTKQRPYNASNTKHMSDCNLNYFLKSKKGRKAKLNFPKEKYSESSTFWSEITDVLDSIPGENYIDLDTLLACRKHLASQTNSTQTDEFSGDKSENRSHLDRHSMSKRFNLANQSSRSYLSDDIEEFMISSDEISSQTSTNLSRISLNHTLQKPSLNFSRISFEGNN